MKTIGYSRILEVTAQGMAYDHPEGGGFVDFERCRVNWADRHGLLPEGRVCVADRDAGSTPMRYLFYDDETVQVVFEEEGGLHSRLFGPPARTPIELRRAFREFLGLIQSCGYTAYDVG